MLENYSISHKLAHRIHLICCLFYINTGCAAVFMWVCRVAYTILLKYAVHILFMTANRSVPRATQLPVTERVWADNVKSDRFSSS